MKLLLPQKTHLLQKKTHSLSENTLVSVEKKDEVPAIFFVSICIKKQKMLRSIEWDTFEIEIEIDNKIRDVGDQFFYLKKTRKVRINLHKRRKTK